MWVLLLLLALPVLAQEGPKVLATPEDIARTSDWASRYPWARGVIDQVITAAKAYPQSHLNKYGLKELALPNEGGQWTHWDVCPVHGASLRYSAPSTFTCPIDNARYSGWPYDQIVLTWRHSDLAASAQNLALAYRWTGDKKFADQAAWILTQYALRYSQYPIHDTNNRVSTTGARVLSQTLDEAVWLIPIAWSYDLIAETLTASDRALIETNLLRAAAGVIRRYDAGASNWQSWHNAAIGAVGFAVRDQELIDFAVSSFRMQMQKSILPEGFWYEGAWSYHFYALDPLVQLAEMAARNGVDLFGEQNLHDMFSAPLQLSLPNGILPAFNDSGETNLLSTDRLYESAWTRWSDPAFGSVLGKRTRGLNALLWGSADLPADGSAALSSKSFPVSGYTALRAPGNDHTVIFKYGPHGGGHGHFDKLNFVSFFNGATMAIDPGTQPYGAPTHTTWDKMTVAHNTVTVDETTQLEATGSLIWDDLGGDTYRAVKASAGTAYKQANLTRTLVLTDSYTVDVFDVEATDGKPHNFDWTYHNAGRVGADGEPYTSFPKTNGYQHLTGAMAVSTGDAWQRTFDATAATPISYGSVYASTGEVKGTFETVSEKAYSGRFSGKASFDGRGTGYLLFTSSVLNLPAASKLKLAIYGDGSGSKLAVRMNDSTDERFVKDLGRVDWTGWREFEVSEPEKWTHYLGNNDGVFDGPVRTVAFELYPSGPGAIYVDDIRLDNAVAVDFELPQRNVRVWMLGEDGTTVVTGSGLGPDLTKPVPFVMARRQGLRTSFVSVIEPFRESPAVLEVSRSTEGAIVIRTEAFTDVLTLSDEGVRFSRQ